jgi:hypothetical protein
MQKIILHQPTCSTSAIWRIKLILPCKEVELMKSCISIFTVWEVQSKIEDAEPIGQNADAVSIDI